jgi:hypothetical protein
MPGSVDENAGTKRSRSILATGVVLAGGVAAALRTLPPGRARALYLQVRSGGRNKPSRRERRPLPHVPIVLNGTRSAPDGVLEYRDRPLYFVSDSQATADGVVQVFTTKDLAQTYCVESGAMESSKRSRMAAFVQDGSVELFRHIDFEGDRWFFSQAWGDIPDFRHVYGWSNININDEVSSLYNSAMSNFLVLFEHIQYDPFGWALYITPGALPNLHDIGWGDMASSMAYRDEI